MRAAACYWAGSTTCPHPLKLHIYRQRAGNAGSMRAVGGGRLGGGGGMEVTYNGVSARVYAQQTCSWRNALCVVLLLEATLCHMHHLCTLKSSSMQRITLAAAAKHHMQAGAKLSAPALGRLGSWSWASSLLSWHCSSSCRSMCCPCESSGDGGPWPGV